MKNAILLHGTGGNGTDYYWFEDTKRYLEAHGYAVWWPQLPHPNQPTLREWLAFAQANMPEEPSSETIIIGHSAGCPLAMSLLQRFKTSIKQAVLVSGFYRPIEGAPELDALLEPYDWAKIRAAAKDIVLINSDNDPWKCDDQQGRPAAEKLGARFILAEGQGHMGSTTFKQPYREFPMLKTLLDVA